MKDSVSENSSDGVSPAIKIAVIILTIVTIITFAVFIFKISLRMSGPSSEQTQFTVHKTVGDRLRADGLREQAIGQYKLFLSQEKMDSLTRAQVSQSIGELYSEMDNCGEALVWFYHVEAAAPSTEKKPVLESAISKCRERIK
jgi:hypothetical protein